MNYQDQNNQNNAQNKNAKNKAQNKNAQNKKNNQSQNKNEQNYTNRNDFYHKKERPGPNRPGRVLFYWENQLLCLSSWSLRKRVSPSKEERRS